MSEVLLIDGLSILNRAFYAMPRLTNLEGMPTGAIYGFINSLKKAIDEEQPKYVIVALDVKKPTFRHELYKEYKGTRHKSPDELREQINELPNILETLKLCFMFKEGFEADDILGSLSKILDEKGISTCILSGDRDLLQLASKNTKIKLPRTINKESVVMDYYDDDVLRDYKVSPNGIIDLKALMGDASDNIPGVNGIGEKTAVKLLEEYGNIENLYDRIDEVKKSKMKENLIQCKDIAFLSKKLATINREVDLEFSLEAAKTPNIYEDIDVYQLFNKLNFKNFLSDFNINNEKIESIEPKITFELVGIDILDNLDKNESYALYYDNIINPTTVAIATKDKTYILDDKDIAIIFEKLNNIIVFDSKEIFKLYNIDINDKKIFDLSLAAYLNRPLTSSNSIYDIVNTYSPFNIKDSDLDITLFSEGNDKLAKLVIGMYYSYVSLKDALTDSNMLKLYEEIELPLSMVLGNMENDGVLVDEQFLIDYSDELEKKIKTIEAAIYDISHKEFNINSPKQLGEVLFVDMGLPNGKKTKTGYSTSVEVLEWLAKDYDIARMILDYRHLSKLRSTYAIGLQNYIMKDKRIHTSFNQRVTATGRISSDSPNLQNIPIRTKEGRLFRKAFIAKEGYSFLDADYSQIELKILAHMSGDETLINAYKNDVDIHKMTAASILNVNMDEVTDEERSRAKAVNFGIIYGMSSFGLSQELGISLKEAKTYIEKYFESFPTIKGFLDDLVKIATQKGYSETIYNRKRPIPELNDTNKNRRSFGERIAMNSPIQGSAADIIKIAMIRTYNRLKIENIDARLILQVHDELLIECNDAYIEKGRQILKEEMENAAKLKVPLSVDINDGKNWYEAK